MIISFIWFGDKKKAKLASIILVTIAGLMLLSAFISNRIYLYKSNNYEKVTAIVTASDATDRTKTWTEFSYVCKGEEYKMRMERMFFRVGLEKELLCNPKAPLNATLYSSANATPLILAICSIPFAFIALMYFINYKTALKKK